MKLPHPIVDSLLAWFGIYVHFQSVNMYLSTIALSMTIVASGLGIYTAIRNLNRTRDNIVNKIEKGE